MNKPALAARMADVFQIASFANRPGVWLSYAGTAYLRLFAHRLRPLRLKPNWVTAMAVVAENPGVTQSALGRALGMNRASAMALCALIEEAGFLVRIASPGRKQNSLSLTPLGERSLLASHEIEAQLSAMLLADLSHEELLFFVGILRKLYSDVSSPMNWNV